MAHQDTVSKYLTPPVAPRDPALTVPSLSFVDEHSAERVVPLRDDHGSLTLGRRPQADLNLSWDPEVSRLHAELTLRAGEWVLADEGWSQNGTFVNGMPLEGKRRLRDGDLITVGRTHLTYNDPRARETEITLAAGELSVASPLSERQHGALVALCRPLLGDGVGVTPASDEEVGEALGVPAEVAARELDGLARAFRLEDLPRAQQRAETALLALRRGIVRHDDAPA